MAIRINKDNSVGFAESQNSVGLSNVAPVANTPMAPPPSLPAITGDPTPFVTPVDTRDAPTNDDEPEDPKLEHAYKIAQLTPKMRRLMDLAIVSDLATGSPVEVIAKNYRLDVLYIQRVRLEWLKACRLQEAFDYRHELKVLALDAVREGLKNNSDAFKRAGIGVRTLQGIGEFKPDTVNIAVLQRIENVPPELRSRYLTSTVEDEQKVIEAEVIDNGRG